MNIRTYLFGNRVLIINSKQFFEQYIIWRIFFCKPWWKKNWHKIYFFEDQFVESDETCHEIIEKISIIFHSHHLIKRMENVMLKTCGNH